MSAAEIVELKRIIARNDGQVARYMFAREELLERRSGAADHVMAELDKLLEVNSHIIAALRRMAEGSRKHLLLMERLEGTSF